MAEHFIPNTQRLRRIERLELTPRDFDETMRFWRRLGVQATIKGAHGRREANIRAGDVRLSIREDLDRAHDRRRAPFAALRLVLAVRSFDDYLAELREKGIACPEPSFERGLTRAVELVDPDGVRILIEETPA